jgi:2-amino-4-hydroxy-6-hydroxymethyldihydropteridine diphosphokinase
LKHIAYIALGANLDSEHGTRAQTLSAAVRRMESLGTFLARSSLYETEPVGFREQAKFLNAVVALQTHLEPLPLLHGLLAIERALGRDRASSLPKGPRTLDLDLLLMEDRIVTSDELSLPHPAWNQRRFVLAPLAEIAPALRPPGTQQTVAEFLAALPDVGENRAAAVRRLSLAW